MEGEGLHSVPAWVAGWGHLDNGVVQCGAALGCLLVASGCLLGRL